MTTVREQEIIQQKFKEQMNEDDLLNCMRCGFCLPACPTYIESGYQESHSPRGRIALMKAVVDGLIEPDEDFEKSMNLCLGCRACEVVCPSGVNYSHLLEQARDCIAQNKNYSAPVKVVRKVVFDHLFPKQNNMRTLVNLIGFYQRSGLQTVARSVGVMKLFPDTIATMERVLPKIATRKEMLSRPNLHAPIGTQKKRVAFFTGCLMDTMFYETNKSTITLLQHAGCEIVIPEDQACCGALHGHYGEKDNSKDMARKNIKAFEDLNVDYIITNAGGCGAFLIEYDHVLHDDPEFADRAVDFVNKLKDVGEILVALDFHKRELRLPYQVITYQDSCHLKNVMKASQYPRILLKAIRGVDYHEMVEADRCCGSAGIYNIIQSEMSMKFLDYKMDRVRDTQATTIATSNPGCLLQMKLGIEREGLSKTSRGVHIVDLLLEAFEYAQSNNQ